MSSGRDYANATFGRITLSERVPGRPGYWQGRCSCGNSVQKRLDNLKRPGEHTCGKCQVPNLTPVISLEERIRRLEQCIASISPDILSRPTPGSVVSLTPSVMGEVREAPQEPRGSRFSRVVYDAKGVLWEARTITDRPFFWGKSEEEAAYAARIYLELAHYTVNQRMITDAELTLSEERREQIRFEVSEGL